MPAWIQLKNDACRMAPVNVMKQTSDQKDLEAEEVPKVPAVAVTGVLKKPAAKATDKAKSTDKADGSAFGKGVSKTEVPDVQEGQNRPGGPERLFVHRMGARRMEDFVEETNQRNRIQMRLYVVNDAGPEFKMRNGIPADLDLCNCCDRLVSENSREKCRHCSHNACNNCIRWHVGKREHIPFCRCCCRAAPAFDGILEKGNIYPQSIAAVGTGNSDLRHRRCSYRCCCRWPDTGHHCILTCCYRMEHPGPCRCSLCHDRWAERF